MDQPALQSDDVTFWWRHQIRGVSKTNPRGSVDFKIIITELHISVATTTLNVYAKFYLFRWSGSEVEGS